jgi:hypothetical protein
VAEQDIAIGQSDELFVEEEGDGDTPLTDTALRLTPLLNGEELANMSGSELKEFLRNLPLLAAEDTRRSGHAHSSSSVSAPVAPGESTNPAVPTVEEDDIIPISAFIMHSQDDSSSLVIEDDAINFAQVGSTEKDNKSSISIEASASLSGTAAAGLLLAANVAGQRGWQVSRLNGEDKVIQGDLQELRKTQSSRKYTLWQKTDCTDKHSN